MVPQVKVGEVNRLIESLGRQQALLLQRGHDLITFFNPIVDRFHGRVGVFTESFDPILVVIEARQLQLIVDGDIGFAKGSFSVLLKR